jgi:hypothetical protein
MKDALGVLAAEVPLDHKPIPDDGCSGGVLLELGEIRNATIA